MLRAWLLKLHNDQRILQYEMHTTHGHNDTQCIPRFDNFGDIRAMELILIFQNGHNKWSPKLFWHIHNYELGLVVSIKITDNEEHTCSQSFQ